MSVIEKLADNGHCVVIFKNDLCSYTAFAVPTDHPDISLAAEEAEEGGHLTDGFSVDQAISMLADKVFEPREVKAASNEDER